MAKVQIRIDPGSSREIVLEGSTSDVGGFVAAISMLMQREEPHAAPAPSKQTGTKRPGIFQRVYRHARSHVKSDRQFAALVAVYRQEFRGLSTTSANVKQLGGIVDRKLANPSVSMREAESAGDVESVRGKKPVEYRPTARAVAHWGKFIK